MAFKKILQAQAPSDGAVYEFNSELFNHFLHDLGLKRRPLLEALSIPPTSWDTMRQSGVVQIRRLVEACNFCRVPLAKFVTFTGAAKVMLRDQWDEDEWKPVEFRPRDFGDYITYGRGQQVDEACAELGFFPSYFYRNYRNEEVSTLTMDTFLRHCNALRVWPGTWLRDDNEPITVLPGYTVIEMPDTARASELQRARQQVRDRDSRIASLEAELERLRAELAGKA